MNITQEEAQKIINSMPYGTTHFYLTNTPGLSSFSDCGDVIPNLFEKWENTTLDHS